MTKLTAIAVEKAKAEGRRREIPDGLLSGLYLIVQPSGAKSWAVRYRSPLDQKSRKLTIGRYPAFELSKAREAGAIALRAVAEGRDPGAEKLRARASARRGEGSAATVKQHFEKFLDRYAKRHTRESSWKETERLFKKEIEPKWGARPLAGISKGDVIELLDTIVDRGAPIVANRVFAIIRKFFNWCIERDQLQHSPCAGVKAPAQERSRERVLSDDELKIIWKACDSEPYPFGPMFKLLIATGQRVGEVAGLSRKELSDKVWTLPASRAKNGREHDVPLSALARSILSTLPTNEHLESNEAQLLFTSNGKTPVSGEARAKSRIAEVLSKAIPDPAPWTLHDVRRTVASGLQRLGFPVEIVEAVLNHKSGKVRGVAAVYARHDYAQEKRAALEAWADYIDRMVSGKTTVLPFVKRG